MSAAHLLFRANYLTTDPTEILNFVGARPPSNRRRAGVLSFITIPCVERGAAKDHMDNAGIGSIRAPVGLPFLGRNLICRNAQGPRSVSVSPFAAVQSHMANDGSGNTVITLNSNDTVTLQHVTVSQLQAGDFLFV